MPPGSASRLETGRNVHAIAVDTAVGLLDYVAEMQADSEPEAASLGLLLRKQFDRLLDFKCRSNGAGGRFEYGQDRVPGRVDEAPALGCDRRSKCVPGGIQRADGRLRVLRHKPRESDSVSRQDG